MNRRLFLLPLLLLLTAALHAEESFFETRLASFLRDHAVLQRDCPVPIWGTASPGSRIALFVDGDLLQTTANDHGAWRVTLPPHEASTGHHLTLVVEGLPIQTLSDIAFGDVWLCAGAEEMEASFFSNIHNVNEELQDAEYPEIRILAQPRRLLPEPTDSLGPEAFWLPASSEPIRNHSALSFFFARSLHKSLGIPIGILCANVSHSSTAAWLPLSTALQTPALASEAAARQTSIHAWLHGGETSLLAAQNAWDSAYDGSDPYAQADFLPCDDDFVEDAQWVTTEIPRNLEDIFDSPAYDGTVWYRRTVFLSAEQTQKQATLILDHVDDQDTTWFNGGQIGQTDHHGTFRRYSIPQAALRVGPNLIAIRVTDTGSIGGLNGNPKNIGIFFDDDSSIDLTQGLWSCRANKAPKGPRPTDPMQNPTAVSACYNGLIHPFAGMALRGILWADGLAEAQHPTLYPDTIRALVHHWRSTFSSPSDSLPIYLYQLSSHLEHHDTPFDSPLATLRWHQMQLASALPNVHVAVTLDDGNPYLPTSSQKRIQADRLAALALSHTYNTPSQTPSDSPLPTSATLEQNHIRIAFNAPLSTSNQQPPTGFQLEINSSFSPAPPATLQHNSILIPIPENTSPTSVRYAWDDFPLPDANLIGSNLHPVSSFSIPIQ